MPVGSGLIKKQQESDRKRNVVQKKKQRDFIEAKHSADIQNKALKFMGAFHKYCLWNQASPGEKKSMTISVLKSNF